MTQESEASRSRARPHGKIEKWDQDEQPTASDKGSSDEADKQTHDASDEYMTLLGGSDTLHLVCGALGTKVMCDLQMNSAI